jgi:ubiquinone/menaquinone biosynthesis C-methylase UbiE
MNNFIRSIVKTVIPKPRRDWLRDQFTTLSIDNNTYENLYESYARQVKADQVVGHGDFDLAGRTEHALLQMEELQPHDTLVDLGCGIGRLAVHVIPTLVGGSYIGIDISDTMLARAKARIADAVPKPPCHITWVKQTTPEFRLPEDSVDIMCAFSVFTHMEHEDSYRYLKAAVKVVKPGGRFIFSCTPLTASMGKQIFLNSANLDLKHRWKYIRNVTTSLDYMTEIAQLAGWSPLRWYPPDRPNIGPTSSGEMYSFDQAICVLEPAARV